MLPWVSGISAIIIHMYFLIPKNKGEIADVEIASTKYAFHLLPNKPRFLSQQILIAKEINDPVFLC